MHPAKLFNSVRSVEKELCCMRTLSFLVRQDCNAAHGLDAQDSRVFLASGIGIGKDFAAMQALRLAFIGSHQPPMVADALLMQGGRLAAQGFEFANQKVCIHLIM